MPETTPRSLVPRVFVCYARHDNASRNRGIRWRDQLLEHLQPFVSEGRIIVYFDELTRTGDEWDDTIQQELAACDVAVLLVGKDFLNSKYIGTREVPFLLERHDAKKVRLVPVLVSSCVWTETRYRYGRNKQKSLAAIQGPVPMDKALDTQKPADRKAALARIAEAVLAEAVAQKPPLPTPPPELHPYLDCVVERCRFVPMRGAQRDERARHGDPQRTRDDPDQRIELERVFVDLDTSFVPRPEEPLAGTRTRPRKGVDPQVLLRPPEDAKPWPALFAVAMPNHRHVVLKGAPGSGKSTFLRFLMLALAQCGQGQAARWSPRIPHWPETELTVVPVRIELRLLDAWLRKEGRSTPKPCHVWDFFLAEYRKLREERSWPEPGNTLDEAARTGRIAFFLDGLDEVATVDRKVFVRDCIQEFAHRGLGVECRLVVTCRTRAYDLVLTNDETLHLRRPGAPSPGSSGEWPVYELAGLVPEQQDQFVKAWYDVLRVLEPDLEPVASERTAALQEALKDRAKPELGEMARTPLLLTVMAHLHSSQRDLRLPDNRAELLEDFVDLLLRRWAERHRPTGPSGADSDHGETLGDLLADPGMAGVTPETFLQMLARVAFEGFRSGTREKPPLVSGPLLTRELRRLYKGLDTPPAAAWAEKVLLYIQHRAGLLHSPDGETYDFPHRLIWEYLTAFHLARTCEASEIANHVTADGYWDEVIRLVAGHFVFVKHEIARGLKVVKALASTTITAADTASNAVGWRRIALAADALHEIGPDKRRQEPDDDARCLTLLQERLPQLLTSGALSARDRARAGRILGHLGDPRRSVVPAEPRDLLATEFCFVPTAPSNSGPSGGFWIARFPVTVAQFRLFATPENYANPAWWSDAAKAGFWQNGQVKVTDWLGQNERWESGPASLSASMDVPNHPMVAVSWFEATAYAAWLNGWLAKSGGPIGDLRLRLPRETEWQVAAQGGAWIPRHPESTRKPLGQIGPESEPGPQGLGENPSPGRRYPWGDEEPGERANWAPTGIGATSAVGCFSAGTSPVGAEEMAGNVWECTASWHDLSERQRVFRGGSWDGVNRNYMSARLRYLRAHPGSRYDYIGFRLVCGRESC